MGNLAAQVLETPGHTLGHIAYWFDADKLAFVGDTLFSIGCGRVIEGNPEMMWGSLAKLRELPDDTRIFCGHEYTQANIRFARTIEPENKALHCARGGGGQAGGGEKADHSLDYGRGARGERVLARRSAGGRCRCGIEREAAGGSVCGGAGKEEQILDARQWTYPPPM